MVTNIKKITAHATMLAMMILSLLFMHTQAMAQASPCSGSLQYLNSQYQQDPVTKKAFDKVYAGLTDLPTSYTYEGSSKNPWKIARSGKGLHSMMVDMFKTWCTALPEIEGTSDNALDPILYFAWLYYQNQAGQDFVQGRDPSARGDILKTGPGFLSQWSDEYLSYMNSRKSAKLVAKWVKDPRIEINDYEKTRRRDYKSWNEFFARNLKSDKAGNYPSRPVSMPGRNYVIVSPTDCIMNPLLQVIKFDGNYERQYIDNPLQLDTVLDVKNIPISVNDMLGSVPDDIKAKFVGGSGLTCVLMPNTYHHFHSPVDGTVTHAEIVKTGTTGTPGTFGYPDFPNWVPLGGNVGGPGTDFSQFQAFQRGVIIIKVEYDNLPNMKPEKLTGYVASIPVGLDSVGSVVLNTCDSQQTDHVNCFKVGGKVQKGKTKFGNFFFGGSLNILLFSKNMISPAVQTRMGNQIGVINLGASPKSTWSLD
ncbi:MAG: phosphatidylserine decarboxylase [Methylococcales bacterium]|nr:phosphatidylserine decarboxylase [Methylococcales bacterium]